MEVVLMKSYEYPGGKLRVQLNEALGVWLVMLSMYLFHPISLKYSSHLKLNETLFGLRNCRQFP